MILSGCLSSFSILLHRLLFIVLCVISYSPSAVMADKLLVPEQVEGVTRVTAEEVFNLVMTEPELVIIDSRKQQPFDGGHIQGALNILDSNMTASLLAESVADKSTPVVFYCNGEKCLRSANASARAYAWGYTRVYWFRGGWKEWTDKELPVSRLKK